MANATIEELLQILVERHGSDLHLSAGSPPKIRVDGSLVNTEHDVLKPEVVKRLCYSFLSGEQVARFEKDLEIDLSFGVEGLGRQGLGRRGIRRRSWHRGAQRRGVARSSDQEQAGAEQCVQRAETSCPEGHVAETRHRSSSS